MPDVSEAINPLRLTIDWIAERLQVSKRKESGAPAPWSDDPIFRRASFCNVERERDRTTVWIREHWRDPNCDNPDVWFLMLVARLINAPEVLAAITLPLPWDRDRLIAEMAPRKAQGMSLERAAYTIPAGRGYANKFEFLAHEIFDPLWAAREHVRPHTGDTCQDFSERLLRFKYLDTFLAGQVVADTKFTAPLSGAADWWTFVAAGNGSGRWLNVIVGRPVNPPMKGRAFDEAFARVHAQLKPELNKLGLELSAQDFQNCCCEAFKYWRVKTQGRWPRRLYRVEGAPAPKRSVRRPTKPKPAPASPVETEAPAPVVSPIETPRSLPGPDLDLLPFRHVVTVDFEFEFGGHASFDDAGRSGERPRPVCMVAKELRSGETWRLWRGEFGPAPPFPIGSDAVVVAYYASAEMGCFRALGWPKPANILDLFTEFRDRTNGLSTPAGSGLVGALTYFGINSIAAQEKDRLRLLVLRGGPWSESERAEILDYCASDTEPLKRLLAVMLPRIDLKRALLRGRYMHAAAVMEHNGTPIDVPTLTALRAHWYGIQDRLIGAIDVDYGVFEGRTFKAALFENWLARHDIPWPRLESGALDLSRDTFREMAKGYAAVSPLHELRHALSEMRLNDLAVGSDGRNRTILSAFRAKTGRNQPSNTKFIFGPSVWLRGLIKPPPGYAIAYCDWSNQEFGIFAKLSGDQKMIAAYLSGDPYIAFGIQCGKLPPDATEKSHTATRHMLKGCVLGIQFGMEEKTLASRIGQPPIVARELLRMHRETYRTLWQWSDAAVDHAMLHGTLHTVFGWHVHVSENPNTRSLRNFLAQANGAEMLRIACCLATERGIEVCCPVHDGILIIAPVDRIDDDVAAMRAAMSEASRAVLSGFEIRTDVNVVRYPDRYMDPRGVVMWERVMQLLAQLTKGNAA